MKERIVIAGEVLKLDKSRGAISVGEIYRRKENYKIPKEYEEPVERWYGYKKDLEERLENMLEERGAGEFLVEDGVIIKINIEIPGNLWELIKKSCSLTCKRIKMVKSIFWNSPIELYLIQRRPKRLVSPWVVWLESQWNLLRAISAICVECGLDKFKRINTLVEEESKKDKEDAPSLDRY